MKSALNIHWKDRCWSWSSNTLATWCEEPGKTLMMGKTIRHLRNWNKKAVGPQRAWGELLLLLFSPSVVSESLQPHGLQHTKFPCPSLSPGVCSNSCPFIRWSHPTISSSVSSSSCPQSVPASGLFQWVISLNQVAKVLEFQLQHQSFQWIFRADFI